jgi:hypothetical protein
MRKKTILRPNQGLYPSAFEETAALAWRRIMDTEGFQEVGSDDSFLTKHRGIGNGHCSGIVRKYGKAAILSLECFDAGGAQMLGKETYGVNDIPPVRRWFGTDVDACLFEPSNLEAAVLALIV